MLRESSGGWARRAALCLALLLPAMLACTVAVLQDPPAALAQDEAESGEAETGEAGAGEGSTTSAAAKEQSLLEFFFGALGWLYSLVFLGLSFTLVALVIMNVLGARRNNMLPVELVESFEGLVKEKRYQEAYETAKRDESFLGRVLAAGLQKLSSGYEKAIEGMQEVGEDENMRLEHRLSYVALIGSISPMVGLLGTVDGMVRSFMKIARDPLAAPKPYELAEGISTALITTLVGLWLAIPAVSAYTILRNRVARLVLEVGIVSENLMSQFLPKKP